MKTKGWGPFRYDWFSVCSTHFNHNDKCLRCNTGSWMNHWRWFIEYNIYGITPNLWRWWKNRKR